MTQVSTRFEALVREDAVHGSVYIEPDIFRAELDCIYSRGWVYIGHESEVPEVGDYKRKSLGLQPVIFCRDKDRNIQVLFNRCRHRAASVCQNDQGNASQFRCEYHGWIYGLDGELKTVPYADAYGELDKSALGLSKPPQVEAYRGFVFANLQAESRSLVEHLGRPTMEQIDLFCDLSPAGEIEVQAGAALLSYKGNWKLQMENSIDGYHPNFTHQSFFQSITRQTGVRLDIFDGNAPTECRALGRGHTHLDYRPVNLAPQEKEKRIGALRSIAWGEKYYDDMVASYGQPRAEEVIAIAGTHMNVFPNLVVLGQQVRTIRPPAPERTEVELAFARLKGVPEELNTMRLRQYEQFYSPQGGGIHDDIEMFNRVGEGLHCTLEPWLIFQRGLHRERVMEDGTVVGQVTDEVSQRAMWRHWLEVMSGND